MKKLLLSIATIIAIPSVFACDICGGGLGSNYVGLLPDFNSKFIGLRYHHNQLRTQLDINGQITPLSNLEKYNTTELWGAWNISDKWRVMAILPFSHIAKFNYGTEQVQHKSGLGDITVSGYYNLFNSNRTTVTEKRLNQSLWIGAGVKLGTGDYTSVDQQSNESPNIYQLGTGSTDVLIQANYDIRLQDLGLNINTNYKINTENKDNYRYGNKAMVSANVYYKFALGSQSRISPNAGIIYEKQQRDHQQGFELEQTGGHSSNYNLGIEANVKKIAVGVNFQKPIQQELGMGRTELRHKISAHISYMF